MGETPRWQIRGTQQLPVSLGDRIKLGDIGKALKFSYEQRLKKTQRFWRTHQKVRKSAPSTWWQHLRGWDRGKRKKVGKTQKTELAQS